jgi:hypothetical protein
MAEVAQAGEDHGDAGAMAAAITSASRREPQWSST